LNKSSSSCDREARPAILVIRFSSLGDILLAAPALRALRTHFPSAHVDFLTAADYAQAASLLPGVDRVIPFQRRSGLRGLLRLRSNLSRRYEFLIDLQNSPRSAFLRTMTFPVLWVKAKRYRFRRWLLVNFKWNLYGDVKPVPDRYREAAALLGVQDDGRGLELPTPKHARAWATEFLQQGIHNRPITVFCPGARHETKQWPADRWMELGRMAASAGLTVCVIGSSYERELVCEISKHIPNSIVLHDREIPEIAGVMQQSAVVVSNDSGLMHLAAGVKTPLVAIFGPTVEPFGFYPYRTRAEVLDHELPCRPCRALGGAKCPKRHFRCMLETLPADVWAAMNRVMKKTTALES